MPRPRARGLGRREHGRSARRGARSVRDARRRSRAPALCHGVLERDDEVAVAARRRGRRLRPLGTALVSVRVLARRARRRPDRRSEREHSSTRPRRCRSPTGSPADRAARSTGWRRRRRLRCLHRARTRPSATTSSARTRCAVAHARSQTRPGPPPAARHSTAILAYLTCMDPGAAHDRIDGLRVRDVEALAFCQAFASDYPAWHRRLALSAIAASGAAAAARRTRRDARARSPGVAQSRGVLASDGRLPERAAQTWLTPTERVLPVDRGCPPRARSQLSPTAGPQR